MQDNHSTHDNHHIGYSTYLLVWISLVAFTSITVTVAGLNLGDYTLLIALSIAAIKSALVINIFMHIKFEDPIFKVFLSISGFTLLVIFSLTFFDYFYR
ncbi:MAG: cytochrome C oxidase subunit IV family protein [Ignavibacteriae bacterium]|nr:cytochrome C oxidase subunit IV family protein [Ignavibacteriota bacterium]MCB9206626.1 cytochrome C oxidase subunit IV family protein [Ignavibacteriales bacterium]MCB9209714.1 cytochrome C oxidase subunit IV family protein [Ignavibacteriales bacterium]MCB9218870.1 cytochrome C oxidase subunit IV family protein [Ignavibacteriales bacterium]